MGRVRKPLDEGFAEITKSTAPPAPTPPAVPANATASKPDNVTTLQTDKRKPVSHVSLYVSPKVIKAVKQIALDTNRKAHEIYLEGLRHVLAQNGRDLDELMSKDDVV